MADFSIGTLHSHKFLRTQCLLVKFDGSGRVPDVQTWSNGVVTSGIGLFAGFIGLSPSL
jgi:hypothetical protein